MFDSIKKWVVSGLLRTYGVKAVRWLAATASAWVASFLYAQIQKHGFVLNGDIVADVTKIAEGVATVITSIGALGFSLYDAKRVDTALKVTAQAGQVVPPPVAAMVAGNVITLSSGKKQIVGQPSLEHQTDAQERQETADLMKAELAKIAA